MLNRSGLVTGLILALSASGLVLLVYSAAGENPNAQPPQRTARRHYQGADAETLRRSSRNSGRRHTTLSDIFTPSKATPSSEALSDQPEHGGMTGFDFYRDPWARRIRE